MRSTTVSAGSQDIGPYAILEDLGPAPFGTAYLAFHLRGERPVVLKVIPPSRPGASQELAPWETLLEETAALSRIYHRGLPALFEVAEYDGALLVAFESIQGKTLHELLAEGVRPDRGQLVDWGCQILDVLAEAHAEGLLHRHIGEDSVLVTPQKRIVLTGFGLTQLAFDPLTAVSPEQLAGDPLTAQSDLYAVGSLLRRLSFATRLKSGGGVAGANGRDPLFKVLARATFRDPAARYRNAADMAEALRQAGRARAMHAVPAPALQLVSGGGTARLASAPVMPFPAAVHSQAKEDEAGDRRWALLLLAVTLLLMLLVIATGWLLIGGETLPATPGAVRTSILGPPSTFEIA